MKKKYRVTIVFKILIAELILSFIGFTVGCMWGLNIENKKWNQLIYSDIEVADINLGGKTKEEARNIIKSQYIDAVLNKKLYVTAGDKIYSADNSQLIKSYDIDKAIEKAFNFGKNLNIIERHKLIKMGSSEKYSLDLTYNDEFIKAFTMNIEKEINKSPVNAAIKMETKGVIKVDADTKGYKIDKEKLDKCIENRIKIRANEDIHIKAPAQVTEAVITQATLSPINACISSFSTDFKSSSYARVNNIKLCVKAINGKVLFPGETFSFNEVVGERTKDRGYMEAPVIIDNKVESGIGGGICQVSSTLYNSILRAGIQHIERTHHSLPSSYVGLGLDATVDWGNTDLKFTNTLNWPIYIEGYIKNNKLNINIFSNSNLSKKKYIIESNIDKNNNSYKVKVIRKTYENGMLTNSEFISNDTYASSGFRYKKGTKS